MDALKNLAVIKIAGVDRYGQLIVLNPARGIKMLESVHWKKIYFLVSAFKYVLSSPNWWRISSSLTWLSSFARPLS